MPAEAVALEASLGSILREDIVADADYPRFDKAIRDGFAVRFEDVSQVPAVLEILGESRAGQAADCHRHSRNVLRNHDGRAAARRRGCCRDGRTHGGRCPRRRCAFCELFAQGEGLLRRAAELQQGERVLSSGRRIELADIGTLASFGKAEVRVSKKPRVAILATGDELVEVRENPLGRANSQQQQLHSSRRRWLRPAASLCCSGLAGTILKIFESRSSRGWSTMCLLVSGGVSMGKYDFVENVFAEFGVQVLFDSVAMKPGKPTVFGHRGETFVFGLPGNPVSTIVAFRMFVTAGDSKSAESERGRSGHAARMSGSAGEMRPCEDGNRSGAGSLRGPVLSDQNCALEGIVGSGGPVAGERAGRHSAGLRDRFRPGNGWISFLWSRHEQQES